MIEAIHEALHTARVSVQLRAYNWIEPVADSSFLGEVWFLDLSLTQRPNGARGRFSERWRHGHYEPFGDVIFIPPKLELRGSYAAGRQTSLSLLLKPELFDPSSGDLDEMRLVESLHVSDPAIRRAMWRLAAEIRANRLESAFFMESSVLSLASQIERRLNKIGGSAAPKRGGLPPFRKRLIEERIQSELPPPKTAELAELCGLSERQLARAFQQETGQSLGAHLAAVTLQRAWSLLTETERRISDIAEALGFSGGATFAEAFRNSTGFRPSDIRRGRSAGARTSC